MMVNHGDHPKKHCRHRTSRIPYKKRKTTKYINLIDFPENKKLVKKNSAFSTSKNVHPYRNASPA